MIKALIFDADGVVINAERFSIQLERDYGISTKVTLPFFQTTFQNCLTGKSDLKNELSGIVNTWSWKGTVEEFLNYWFKTCHKIDEEMIDYVQKIKESGIKCLVATNNERYRTEYMIDQMGFGQIFDRVYGSGHMGYKKPDFQFFQHILQDQNLNPSEVLFWDDDEENVKAAQNLGMQSEVYQSAKGFQNLMSQKYQINLD